MEKFSRSPSFLPRRARASFSFFHTLQQPPRPQAASSDVTISVARQRRRRCGSPNSLASPRPADPQATPHGTLLRRLRRPDPRSATRSVEEVTSTHPLAATQPLTPAAPASQSTPPWIPPLSALGPPPAIAPPLAVTSPSPESVSSAVEKQLTLALPSSSIPVGIRPSGMPPSSVVLPPLRQPLQLPLCHSVLLIPPPLQPPYLGGQHLQPSSFAFVELLQSFVGGARWRGSRQENLAPGDGFWRALWSFMQSLRGFPCLSPPFSVIERRLSHQFHRCLFDTCEHPADFDDVTNDMTNPEPKIRLPYNWLVTKKDEVENIEAKTKENNLSNVGL
ncbi:hypothetical protein Fmac_021169 [Flemingia macrophylla]|uniref:Uncharacterized protein n=1 Tax=Flemingia macrophylla TaxID=520843 RepID=A0ABD1LW50_9FABA